MTPEEELKYAKALYDSVEMKSDKLPGDATEDSSDIYEYVDEKSKHGTTPMNEFLVPYLYYEKPRMGSTDVGDVSWVVPTVQTNVCCYAAGTALHSWQAVAQGKASIAHKGMLTAAKVMACTGADLLENPELIKKAHKDWLEELDGETYPNPLPPEVKPGLW